MGVSKIAYLALLLAVALGRLLEMRLSARHQRRLASRGVAKVAEPHFRWMVLLHGGVLVSAALEVLLLRRPLIPGLATAMALLFLLANGLRWWVIATMSEHWNVEVMASTRLGIVTHGPFRWIRHPNYLAVFLELLALPLIHTAWLTALWGSVAHLRILRLRIATEENVLLADPAYRTAMGTKPRFFPRIFSRRSLVPNGESAHVSTEREV